MKIKGDKGFTTVELMVVTAISSILTYGIFLALQTGSAQMETSKARRYLQDQAREGLYKMVQEIRQSAPDRITIANGGTLIRFDVPDPAAPVNADFTVNWGGSHSIQYALGGLNGRQLIRTDLNSGLTTVMANDVGGLVLAGDGADPNVVTITLSVQRNLANQRPVPAVPLQMTAQAEVRNIV